MARLVGRSREVRVLDDALDGLEHRGSASMLQIVGEAGTGKSRLLAEAIARAEDRNVAALSGRSAEFERDLVFGTFTDALDRAVANLDDDERHTLTADLPELAPVLPALARTMDADVPPLREERYRTYRAVHTLIERLATSAPLAIALDDVHWADPASVELLAHLVTHPPQAPVLLLVTYRPVHLPAQLASALAGVARRWPSTVLEPRPLSRDDVATLLGDATAVEVVDEVYRDSGGNPLYVEQLRRTLGDVDTSGAAHGVPRAVPALVRESVRAELAGLTEKARALLGGGAAAGDPFPEAHAAVAAGLADEDVPGCLDELLARDLLCAAAVARSYRFRHPLVRRAVYELAAPSWRQAAHQRLAEWLHRQGLPATARARHVERSARAGDLDAVAVLTAAGDATAATAPLVAARWYAAARSLLPDTDANRDQWLNLLIAGARALGSAGQLDDSRAALTDALARVPPTSPAYVDAAIACSSVDTFLGQHQRASARLHDALERLSDPSGVAATRLAAELAACAPFANDFAAMRHWAGEAHRHAEHVGAPAETALADALIGYANHCLGDHEAAQRHADTAAAAFDGVDDATLARHLDLGHWLAWLECHIERYDDAIRHVERAVAVSRSTGHGQFLVGTMNAATWAMLQSGRLLEARALSAAAADASRTNAEWGLSEAIGFHAVALCLTGDLAAAQVVAAEATDKTRQLDPGLMTAAVGMCSALVHVEAGEHHRAGAALLRAGGGADLPYLQIPGVRQVAYEALTVAALGLNNVADAERYAAAAASGIPSDSSALPVAAAAASRALAAVRCARGQFDEAAELAEHAAVAVENVAALPAARCRLAAGRARARVGQRAAAVTALRRAEQEFAQIGAAGLLELTTAELRRLGQRVRSSRTDPPVQHLDALTPREREIADLVCGGLTNREIARSVYVSEKTVERHLSQIYTKLGVANRTGLASLVERGQAAAPPQD